MDADEPVELKTLRSILGAYAKQVLHWHELDDENEEVGASCKSLNVDVVDVTC